MNLAIQSVAGHGDQQEERVNLRAIAACNLDYFMLADTTYVDQDHVSNKLRHVHWFCKQELDKGDWVVLHTGRGTDSAVKQSDGSTVYHRYWNLDRPIWNDTGDRAILLALDHWKATPVK